MRQEQIIDAFVKLGNDITQNANKEPYLSTIDRAILQNPWFTKENIYYQLHSIAQWMRRETLNSFVASYRFASTPKTIAVISAGNLPLVCWHDVLCVLLSGHRLMLKMSSQDSVLAKFLLQRLAVFGCAEYEIVDKISNFHAVIATGSNSSSLYFQSYFAKYPYIIRKSRSSFAIVQSEDIQGIEDDIFLHFGMGCRSCSLIFLPRDFDFGTFETIFSKYSDVIHHNKYRNNLDYYKAIFEMNALKFRDMSSVLMIEKPELHSPISVLNYAFYDDISEVLAFADKHIDELQCIVTHADKVDLINSHFKGQDIAQAFGMAQQPSINTFADNIDTMRWIRVASGTLDQ